ncbi:MAG: alpha/beta hydrolase fold domain-containing protein [Bacteroidota bacterium]
MQTVRNVALEGKHKKPIVTDLFYKKDNNSKPVVIFCHGYKGYKDWGAWNLAAERFAQNNIFFVKFNFSHNGGTLEQPIDFPDLEAFGKNNYTKELDDLESVLDWILDNQEIKNEIDPENITLIGHSRGGGIVGIKASEDSRITKIISWAGVSDFGSRFPKEDALKKWKKDGVYFIINGRTKQEMPHFFQFYSNFKENEKRLNIESAIKNIRIPHLIIHGSNDETVNVEEAKNIHLWSPKSELKIINGANHTFDSKHPYNSSYLPSKMVELVDLSINFIKNI